MGNMGSSGGGGGNGRRRNQSRRHNTPSVLPSPPPPEIAGGNRYIFAAAMPYAQSPNPNTPSQYYNYVGYYPPPPTPTPSAAHLPAQLPAPLDHHHRSGGDHHQGWRNPHSPAPPPRTPIVEHQKAVTIRNDVNLKKETLVIEPDEENPGRYLVAFTFDAAVAGR